MNSRESGSFSGVFPTGGKLLHIQTSAAFPSTSGPLFPPRLRGLLQRLSSLGGGYQSERGERRIPVDTSVLLPAGIGVFYALLILVSLKFTARRSKAIQIGSEIAEINFALREGHTIVGVMDTKKAM